MKCWYICGHFWRIDSTGKKQTQKLLYKNVGNILYYYHINYNHLKSQNETAVWQKQNCFIFLYPFHLI